VAIPLASAAARPWRAGSELRFGVFCLGFPAARQLPALRGRSPIGALAHRMNVGGAVES
jgi:hypothetical protein